MGTGYTRNDTVNNIADGNVINASDLDGEFDAIQAAFNESTGHTHDGTSAEGAPITKLGPAQDVDVGTGAITPKIDNTVDLGSGSLEFKDLYIDGTANIDSLVADTADINAGTIDGTVIGGSTPAAATVTTLAVNGNTTLGDAATDTVTFTADVASNVIPSADNTYDLGASGSEWKDLYVDGTANIDSLVADTADINAGTIDGVTIGGAAPGVGTFTTANATTVDATNIEVTNIKAKDGSASATIADGTGVMTIGSAVLTTADINGGTADNVVIGGATAAAGTFTTLSATGNVTLGNAATDTVTITADVASNIIPSADNTYDLGAVGSEWKDLYVDGTANIDSLVADTADINAGTIDGTAIGGSTPAAGSFTTLNTSGQVVFNDAGADVDFRVEGDTDANLLFVDASADAVGIGKTPIYKLDVAQTGAPTTTAGFSMARIAGANATANDLTLLGPSASQVRINFGDADSGSIGQLIYNHNANSMGFVTNGSVRATIDSSGNVGIGTSSPAQALDVVGSVKSSGTFLAGVGTAAAPAFTFDGDPDGGMFRPSVNTIAFATLGAERMRIDNGGNLLVGTTINTIDTSNFGCALRADGSVGFSRDVDVGSATMQVFGNAGQFRVMGNGNCLNTNNSYGQISDIKTKQDIVDAASQWDDIKNIRVRKFRFKDNPTGVLQIGVVAQELEKVSPGLIEEQIDFEEVTKTREVEKTREVTPAVLDEDGNEIEPAATETYTEEEEYTEREPTGTVTKAVKYSILYMKAVKALQEAMERIETLEASNTALEARIAALENA